MAQKNLKRAREPGRESIIIVTTDGLRVFEALTEEQLLILDLTSITFAGVDLKSGPEEALGVIETDFRLDQKNWCPRPSPLCPFARPRRRP